MATGPLSLSHSQKIIGNEKKAGGISGKRDSFILANFAKDQNFAKTIVPKNI